MRLLILGRDGQVGSALAALDWDGWTVNAAGRAEADLATPAAVRLIETSRPDFVINAAAMTDVEAAEGGAARDLAFRINGEAPGELARACLAHGAWLIHYSTDYVFDGTLARPYVEGDATCPINAYGASKLAGEQAIMASGCKALILRTSWVYDDSHVNFLTRVIARARGAAQLPVVDDQFGAPTWADTVAHATRLAAMRLAADGAQGVASIHHVTPSGRCNWFEYAGLALKELGIATRLEPVSAASFPARARRPANSLLDATGFVRRFGWKRPRWQDDLSLCLARLRERSGR